MEERKSAATATTSAAVEDTKRRCIALCGRLTKKSKLSLPPAPKATLLRLINSELAFLHRLSTTSNPSPLSFNIGHLESVVHVLQHSSITGVSRVCKAITLSPSRSIYVDIVCSYNGNPVWFIISDRNPRYITWDGDSSFKSKGLKKKIEQVIDSARESPVTLMPSSVVFFFSSGLDDRVCEKLRHEFGGNYLELMEPFSYEEVELEEEWTDVVVGRSFSEACVIEIKVDKDHGRMNENKLLDSTKVDGLVVCKMYGEYFDSKIGTSLCSFISKMKCWCCSVDNDGMVFEDGLTMQLPHRHTSESKMVNFDTTAMVAIVSGISNGGIEKLLAKPESELRSRFKGNYEFVIAQVESEKQNPIHVELTGMVAGKRGVICESAFSEFKELISMCGGPTEKLRAEYFLKFLKVVPDSPSTRLTGLPTTRKLALKNKLVFGTGDYWYAPTVTANMGFVRAVSQTGMSLPVIEHRPRALIGD